MQHHRVQMFKIFKETTSALLFLMSQKYGVHNTVHFLEETEAAARSTFITRLLKWEVNSK